MRRPIARYFLSGLWLVLVSLAAAAAHEPTLRLPLPGLACRSGSPYSVWVVNASSATDCSTGGGTTDNECCCLDGSWVDCVGAGSGVTSHGDLTDLLEDDHTQYPLLAGRVGGQIVNGGAAPSDNLIVQAHNSDGNPAVEMDGSATDPVMRLLPTRYDSLGNFSGSMLTLFPDKSEFVVDGTPGAVDFLTVTPEVVARIGKDGIFGTKYGFRAGDADSDAGSTCLSVDTDRYYGDVDCDRVKDSGEEYIDQAGGGSGAPTDADYLVKTAHGSLSAERVVTDTDTITWNWSTGGQAKAEVNLGTVAPYQQWDPDRPPSSCAVCDEFTGDTETLSGEWMNQDSASFTMSLDALFLTGEATGNEIRGRCYTPPSSGNADFTAIVRITQGSITSATGCGLLFLTGGTVATPTQVKYLRTASDGSMTFTGDSDYDLASGATNHASTTFGAATNFLREHYLRIDYDNTGSTVSAYGSATGTIWRTVATGIAVSGDPSRVCLIVHDDNQCAFAFLRMRTDAGRTDASD